MFSSLLIIAIVGGVLFGVNRWRLLPPEERVQFTKKGLIYGVAGITLALVLVGKAHWLMGVLAALLALAGRAVQFVPYVPLFKKMMGDERAQKERSSNSVPNSSSSMSRQDAADILGLDIDANKDEIKIAHKRLIQKLHPDRGGSDALARQINMAKDVLLNV